MLVATPGQTTAYVLHNNNKGASGSATTSTTTASIPAVVSSSANNPASLCVTSSVVTTKKQQAVLNKLSSSKEIPNCVNNNNINSIPSNATSKTAISTTTHQNNFNFHLPPTKRDANSIVKSSIITVSQKPQHSLNNSNSNCNISTSSSKRPPSFLSTLKDTVQKALVTTASSLTKNGGNRTTAIATTTTTTSLNSSNTSSSNNNLSASSLHVTSSSCSSSSLSLATTKNSSATIITTVASAPSSSSSASSSTILPLTIARKKFSIAISTQPKLHTIPPTTLHRCAEERKKTSSTDSLEKEMCHFKPIRTVPTTPWKSGSKSRGSSLRFPKANLATTKTEFNLKSNCDVNNRKTKQQTKSRRVDSKIVIEDSGENSDNNEEQENQVNYEIYKPKPSSLHLCATFLTQNHQSAFVCLVANLMNIQSTKKTAATTSAVSVKGDKMVIQKSKNPRNIGRSKKRTAVATKLAPSNVIPVKEIFVRSKKFKSPLPPPPHPPKRSKLSSPSTRSQRISNVITESSELLDSITPSRRSLKGAKSNSSDIEPNTGQRNTRKRKATTDETELQNLNLRPSASSFISMTGSPSTHSTSLSRRWARLTAESGPNNIYMKYPELCLSRIDLQTPGQQNNLCFSPPLTRSRLKQFLSEQQSQKEGIAAASAITPSVGIKKRKG